MTKAPFSGEITRTTLAVLLIAIIISTCFWIIKPFLFAIIWAAMLVIATWPLLLLIQARVGNRRGVAVLIMTLLLLVILIVPMTLAIITIIGKAQELFANSQSLAAFKIPSPPEWLQTVPFVGAKAAATWQEFARLDQAELAGRLAPHAQKIIGWVLVQAGSAGMLVVHCFLTVIIAAVMYTNGETAATGIRLFVSRIAGKPGEDAAILAAKAVRGVAIGIVGTALVQSLLAGIGLLLCSVPAPLILTAVIFLLCAAQVGPVPVLIPAAIWLFLQNQTGWGVFMIVWTVIIATIDNFLRPLLIRKGADLPLILIFAGVIGGLLSFGMIGLFIGPVMLAVSYTLLKEWISAGETVTSLNSNRI